MLFLVQDDAAWHRLIALAHERGTQLQLILDNGDAQRIYRASSYSRPGTWHWLDVEVSGKGIRFDCSCEAHRDGGKPCTHAACMLEALGFLSLPAPAPDVAPTPVDARPLLASEPAAHLRGARALALLNSDDDELDRIDAELAALEAGR